MLAWGIRCNIPLDEALLTLRTKVCKESLSINKDVILWEIKKNWNLDLTRAAGDLKAGHPVCLALNNNLRRYFPAYVISALEEGERHQKLDTLLPLLAHQMRYSAGVFKQRTFAFAYPVFQMLTVLALGSFLAMLIIPRFAKIYYEMAAEGVPLPAITQSVFQLGELAPFVFASVILALPTLIVFRFFYMFEPTARFFADLFLLHIPFWGKDLKKMAMMEMAGSMAAFTAVGFDIIKAAEMTLETVSSFWLRRRLERFIEQTESGVKWIDAWDDMHLGFPFYDWLARNSAAREEVTEGFMQMMKWLRRDISSFSFFFIKFIEIAGLLLNTLIVGFIVLGLGYGLFNIARVVAEGVFRG